MVLKEVKGNIPLHNGPIFYIYIQRIRMNVNVKTELGVFVE